MENIYLSQSYFTFKDDNDDFSEREKQKQVLKSLIVLSLVKNQKQDTYHDPLLITLVNSINTDESDLLLFFKRLKKLQLEKSMKIYLMKLKKNFLKEFRNNKSFVFGEEKLEFDISILESLSQEDLLECVLIVKIMVR